MVSVNEILQQIMIKYFIMKLDITTVPMQTTEINIPLKYCHHSRYLQNAQRILLIKIHPSLIPLNYFIPLCTKNISQVQFKLSSYF